jgi:glycosyltransferase involved in cell wall biosynthesis
MPPAVRIPHEEPRMRILMVAPEPIFEPRGTPLSVVGRLKTLSDLGHSVDLLTYSIGQDVAFPRLKISRIPKVPGIRKIKIGPSAQKLPLDFLLMLKTLASLAVRRYDLMHTHEEAGFWGALFSPLFGVPHLYDMHSSLPQQLENFQFSRSRALIALFRFLEKAVLRTAKGVIVICPDLKTHVESMMRHPNLALIENVVDYGMVFGVTDRSARFRRKYGLAGKKVVLYTGTFEPYQGLGLLVASAAVVLKRVPSAVFLMVGGHGDQVEALRREAEKRGVAKAFVFTGQVQPQEVGSAMRCADALVSPRTAGNNTPLKIYAYLRSGVPIVATRLPTHTQVLNDGVAVLTRCDSLSFGEGVARVLKDRRLAAALGRRARKLADERYGFDAYKRKLSGVVRRSDGRGGR